MPVPDDHLRIEIKAKDCQIPADERERLRTSLTPLVEAVRDIPGPALSIEAVHHPASALYDVKFQLKVPGRSLFTGAEDPYLDSAMQCCIRKMQRKIETYKEHPDQQAEAAAERLDLLNRDLVAPAA